MIREKVCKAPHSIIVYITSILALSVFFFLKRTEITHIYYLQSVIQTSANEKIEILCCLKFTSYLISDNSFN